MPSSTSNSKDMRTLPWGLVATVALLVVFESALAFRGAPEPGLGGTFYGGHEVPSMEESVVQWQVAHAMASQDPVDLVVIGDSSCLMGVRPKELEEVTGRTAINLGTVATLYSDGHADLLEEFIERRGVPKAVVYHTSAIYGIGFYSAEEIDETGLLQRYRLWRGIRPRGLASNVPSVRRFRKHAQDWPDGLLVSREARRSFLEVSRGPYPSDVAMRAMVEELGGGMVEPEQWDWTREQPEEARSLHYNEDVFPGLRRIAALAETYGFDLIIVLNPMPEAYRSADFEAAFAEYMTAFERELPAIGRLKYLTPRLRYYSDGFCGTVCHLNDPGAVENSRQIGKWLVENVDV